MNNKPRLVWEYFKIEEQSKLKRAAAQLMARLGKQAADSGLKIGELDLYPTIWIEPIKRLTKRFGMSEYAVCVLRAYYNL